MFTWEAIAGHPGAVRCRHHGYEATVAPLGAAGVLLSIRPNGPVRKMLSVEAGQVEAEEILRKAQIPEVRVRVPACLIPLRLRNGTEVDVEAVRSALLRGEIVPGCELAPAPLPTF